MRATLHAVQYLACKDSRQGEQGFGMDLGEQLSTLELPGDEATIQPVAGGPAEVTYDWCMLPLPAILHTVQHLACQDSKQGQQRSPHGPGQAAVRE